MSRCCLVRPETLPRARLLRALVAGAAIASSALAAASAQAPVLTGFRVEPAGVTGGDSAELTLTLSSPAPAGGFAVTISGEGQSTEIRVAAGERTHRQAVPTPAVKRKRVVTLTAAAGDVRLEADLTILPAPETRRPDPPPAAKAPEPAAPPAPPSDRRPTERGGARHEYFEALCSRPDMWKCYSLRTPEMLEQYRHSRKREQMVTYDAGMDAAKILVSAATNSLTNQVRLPMHATPGESYLVTWDAWFGPEWRYRNTGISNYKTWQFAAPRRPDGRATLWLEVQTRFLPFSNDAGLVRGGEVGLVGNRYYPSRWGNAFGPNVRHFERMEPRAGNFVVRPAVWTRYWALFEPCGDWLCYSLWVADERRDPVRVQDASQIRAAHGIAEFWIEYNTSTNPVAKSRGPLVSFNRNVVMLRGIRSAQIPALLTRPVP